MRSCAFRCAARSARLQKELAITTVYVTHDQEEAMAISDRIAIMNAGRIAQIGTRGGALSAARFGASSRHFSARPILIKCRIVEVAMDLLTLGIGDISWALPARARSVGAHFEAVVRPEAIKLSTTGKGLPGQVVSATYLGSKVDYLVRVGDQTLRVVQSDPAPGSRFAEGAVVDVILPHAGVQILGEGPNGR